MRQYIVTAALVYGLLGLWTAILPAVTLAPTRTAQTASISSSPISEVLLSCSAQHSIDRACVAALTKALIMQQPAGKSTSAADKVCLARLWTVADLEGHH
jgi:hypothetical protein